MSIESAGWERPNKARRYHWYGYCADQSACGCWWRDYDAPTETDPPPTSICKRCIVLGPCYTHQHEFRKAEIRAIPKSLSDWFGPTIWEDWQVYRCKHCAVEKIKLVASYCYGRPNETP